MKVWRIPEDQLERWLSWRAREEKWQSAFGWIEEVTGIKPLAISNGGHFEFTPPPGIEIPEHFTKPNARGAIRPKSRHPIGKNLLDLWKDRGFGQPIHVFFFWEHMGIRPEPGVGGVYRVDKVAGQLCLIAARGWNPEDYGYSPVEI